MLTFFYIVGLIVLVLGAGMVTSLAREKKVRAWIASHGGNLHWPFVPDQHPKLPAQELSLRFHTRGARLWATGIEVSSAAGPLWLIEFEASEGTQQTGHWYSLWAEACDPNVAHALCQQRTAATGECWIAYAGWVARRSKGFISTMLLNELQTRKL